MVYGGIDYSVNCPCLCIYDDSLGQFNHKNCLYYFYQANVSNKEKERRKKLNFGNIIPSYQYNWDNDYAKYFSSADYFLSILVRYDVKIVGMEDYAMGAKGKVFNIAECTSILKYMMLLCGIKFYTYAPTYVKKVFSGKGNADKELMCKSYKEKYGIDISEIFDIIGNYDSPVSDCVDSHAMLYTYFYENNK